jgi:mono/diheme cytochrome c family protein
VARPSPSPTVFVPPAANLWYNSLILSIKDFFMKLRSLFILAFALLLTACSFSLAEDVTPPPDYVPPTPVPTLGPVFPSSAPDPARGAAIFAEKCAPCHGAQGLGDGPQGKQLPVPVAPLGLPEFAAKASPARWFTVVTQGNMDRFMPPFTSLNEQQRWDVVAYALTLHTTPAQVEEGKSLFEANCAACPTDLFTSQEKMAALSGDDLANIVRQGQGDIPAFGSNLSDEQVAAVVTYLRSLSFASATPPTATPEPVTVTSTPLSAEATPAAVGGTAVTPAEGTPAAEGTATASAEGTPVAAATQPEVTSEAPRKVVGSIENKSGVALPADLTVRLRGFDHAQDASGPQETLTLEGTVQSDGTFQFENVELPAGRIFIAEVTFQGITFQSDLGVVNAGDTQVNLPPVVLYAPSDDFSVLSFTQVHIGFDFGSDGTLQVFEIYTFTNPTDRAIVIKTDGNNVPFISLPANAQNVGFDIGQDSAPYFAAEGGFALLPSSKPYSLIAFFTLPYDARKTEIVQPFVIGTKSVVLFVPAGVKIKGEQLTDSGPQTISNTTYQTFSAQQIAAGANLTFTLSGQPKQGQATQPAAASNQKLLLIGAGALGVVLILAGVWLYWRDRNRADEEEEDAIEDEADEEDAEEADAEYETKEDILDAIVALDDLYRAGKINEEAYRKRREELKAKLKEEL